MEQVLATRPLKLAPVFNMNMADLYWPQLLSHTRTQQTSIPESFKYLCLTILTTSNDPTTTIFVG